MNESMKKRIFLTCCYGYFSNGMVILVIGVLLPFIMRAAGLSYATAGALLSMMATGSFLSSFLFPIAAAVLGTQSALVVTSALTPVSLAAFCFLPPLPVMMGAMFLIGLSRGCISLVNNQAVNDTYDSSSVMLNYLHCCFAIGAFLAPFAASVFITLGFNWRIITWILTACSASAAIAYGLTSVLSSASSDAKEKSDDASSDRSSSRSILSFLKEPDFLILSMLLFFYIGFENCVNGWFVTYLQDTGLVSEALASTLVSVTWIVILVGRLVVAHCTKYFRPALLLTADCVGTLLFFAMLVFAENTVMVSIAMAGIGFCMGGIYPFTISEAGHFINGSTLGIAVLTAIASFGGILTPQLVGIVADSTGMVQAIAFLLVAGLLMALMSVIHVRRSSGRN